LSTNLPFLKTSINLSDNIIDDSTQICRDLDHANELAAMDFFGHKLINGSIKRPGELLFISFAYF
jgi:hypothetical protein